MTLTLAFEGLKEVDQKYLHTLDTLIPITWQDYYTYSQAAVTLSEHLHKHRATVTHTVLPLHFTVGETSSYWVSVVYAIQRLAQLCCHATDVLPLSLTCDINDDTSVLLTQIQQTLGALTWVRTRAFVCSTRTHHYKEELEKLRIQLRAYGLWLIGRRYMQTMQWHQASDVFYTLEQANVGRLSLCAEVEKVFARAHELPPWWAQAILKEVLARLSFSHPVIAQYLLSLGPAKPLHAKSPLLTQTYEAKNDLLILGLEIYPS